MDNKQKPAASTKSNNPPPKDIPPKKAIQDEINSEAQTTNTDKVQNERKKKSWKERFCDTCTIQWASTIISFTTAFFAFLVWRQADTFFNIEKKPFLQLSDFSLDSFEVGKTASISFKINNLGGHPTKVIGGKVVTAIRITPPPYSDIDSFVGKPISIIDHYIIKDAPQSQYLKFKKVDDRLRYVIISGDYAVYVLGFIEYINLVTKEKSVYKYMVKIKPPDYNYLLNENEESD